MLPPQGARPVVSTARLVTMAACAALVTTGIAQSLYPPAFLLVNRRNSFFFPPPLLSGATLWFIEARRSAVSMAACHGWTAHSPLTAVSISSMATWGTIANKMYLRSHLPWSRTEQQRAAVRLQQTLAPDRTLACSFKRGRAHTRMCSLSWQMLPAGVRVTEGEPCSDGGLEVCYFLIGLTASSDTCLHLFNWIERTGNSRMDKFIWQACRDVTDWHVLRTVLAMHGQDDKGMNQFIHWYSAWWWHHFHDLPGPTSTLNMWILSWMNFSTIFKGLLNFL